MKQFNDLTTDEQIKAMVRLFFDMGYTCETIAKKTGVPLPEVIALIAANLLIEGAEREGLNVWD